MGEPRGCATTGGDGEEGAGGAAGATRILLYDEFCRSMPAAKAPCTASAAPSVASLPQVYIVYRSMVESNLWQDVLLSYDAAVNVYYLRSLPARPHLPQRKAHATVTDLGDAEGADHIADDGEARAAGTFEGTNSEEQPEGAGVVRPQDCSEALTIPVGTSHHLESDSGLTLARLHALYILRSDPSMPLSLAFVDENAFVTFNYVHDYLQPPTEAPTDELQADDMPIV